MADVKDVDWDAVMADSRFQSLRRKKTIFLWVLMVFSMTYYFVLPLGAAYFPHVFQIKIWGVLNVGLLFALSQFVVAWAVAFCYERRASGQFDVLAKEIVVAFHQQEPRR